MPCAKILRNGTVDGVDWVDLSGQKAWRLFTLAFFDRPNYIARSLEILKTLGLSPMDGFFVPTSDVFVPTFLSFVPTSCAVVPTFSSLVPTFCAEAPGSCETGEEGYLSQLSTKSWRRKPLMVVVADAQAGGAADAHVAEKPESESKECKSIGSS